MLSDGQIYALSDGMPNPNSDFGFVKKLGYGSFNHDFRSAAAIIQQFY